MPGINSKLAFMKGATWATLAALGTNHRAPFLRCSLGKAVAKVPNEEVQGKSTRGVPDNGAETIGGSVSWLGDYRQSQHLLVAAALHGAAGAPTLVETGVNLHVMKWQPGTDGIFLSAGVDLAAKDVHGFSSVKPVRRTIEIRGGGRWEESVDFIGAGLDATIASSGWTFRYDPIGNGARRILGSQTVVRANTHAGGALGAPEVIKPRRITIALSRQQEGDIPLGQVYMDEPILADFAEVMVTLEFFDMSAALLALFRDNRDAGTPMKMDLVSTHGTLLGATKYRQRSLYFPKMVVVDCPTEIPGGGPVPLTVTLSAHYSDVVPTGFPATYQQEVVETAQLELATDILA